MPRPKKTDAQLNEMRGQILNAAYDILLEKGPEGLTSRAIAERLGVTHMALFTYFENQAAILDALRERENCSFEDQQDEFEQRAQSGDVSKVVLELLEFFISIAYEKPNIFRLVWVMPELMHESTEENRRRMRTHITKLAALLKLGMERGVFEPRDPILAASTVAGMIYMPFILFYTGKMFNVAFRDRMANELLDAAMCYLRKDDSPSIHPAPASSFPTHQTPGPASLWDPQGV